MILALSIFGIAFGALCVWLVVRIVNRRERWAKWTLATVVVVPVFYALLPGPMIWLSSHDFMPELCDGVLKRAYPPLVWIIDAAPEPIGDAYLWYLELWRSEPK